MLISAVVTYNIIDCIDPPVTEDSHRNIPTENIAKSLFLSFILGATVFITAIKILRRGQKK